MKVFLRLTNADFAGCSILLDPAMIGAMVERGTRGTHIYGRGECARGVGDNLLAVVIERLAEIEKAMSGEDSPLVVWLPSRSRPLFPLPEPMIARIDAEAALACTTRETVIGDALEQYLTQQENSR